MKDIVTTLFKLIFIATAISISTVGCTTNNTPIASADICPLPTGHLVGQAFSTAKSTLIKTECQDTFDAVFDSLLDISAGAPDTKNKEMFSDLLGWAKDHGIISTLQAKERYTKYFASRFVSLPDTYQTCSHCPRIDSIIGQCKNELQAKDKGLLKVSSDKATYAKANDDLLNIELILLATCSACAAE